MYHLENLSIYQPRTSREIFFIKPLEDFYSLRLTFYVDLLEITPPLKDFYSSHFQPHIVELENPTGIEDIWCLFGMGGPMYPSVV